MIDIVFNMPEIDLIEIEGWYSFSIIALSILITTIASFTALTMNKRVQKNSFFHRNYWIGFSGFAMGIGIWSMHFVGMLAFTLPVKVTYNPTLTLLSIIPGLLASYLAFYIANRPKKSILISFISSVIIGLGISMMHYLGMTAMQVDLHVVYDKKLFLTSIIVAIMVSIIALAIISTFNKYNQTRYIEKLIVQTLASVILGIAVSSMHYIGMFAVSYYAPLDFVQDELFAKPVMDMFIVVSIIIGTLILIASLVLITMIDRYVKYRTSYYDSLTVLPNRRKFERIVRSNASQQALAIWHIHDFEKVNYKYGYLFGDKVIEEIARIMDSYTPPMTELYRIEGNRFAYLKKNEEAEWTFYHALESLSDVFKQSIIVDGEEVSLSTVCGWQSVNEEHNSLTVYSNVLAVLNNPGLEYKHEVIHYNPEIHTYTYEKEIAEGIEQAMDQQELYLVYQPKVNGKTKEITGMESLLRWNHPTYGLISPAIFIPILEKKKLMFDVTDWVIEQVCQQIAEWRKEEVFFGQVAINISGQYVTSPTLLVVLKRILDKYHLSPNMIELEITETSIVNDIEEAVRAVHHLRKEGYSVALDDFGTGVSSLSYLKEIPITTLKIDKSFIDEVPESKRDSSVVQAIIAIGGSLGLSIVFEGVETKEQAKFLATTCESPIIQGYYYSKPMLASEWGEWSGRFRRVVCRETS